MTTDTIVERILISHLFQFIQSDNAEAFALANPVNNFFFSF